MDVEEKYIVISSGVAGAAMFAAWVTGTDWLATWSVMLAAPAALIALLWALTALRANVRAYARRYGRRWRSPGLAQQPWLADGLVGHQHEPGGGEVLIKGQRLA